MVFLSRLLVSLPLFCLLVTIAAGEESIEAGMYNINKGSVCGFYKPRWGLVDSTAKTYELGSDNVNDRIKVCRKHCSEYTGELGCNGFQITNKKCLILFRLIKEFLDPNKVYDVSNTIQINKKSHVCGRMNIIPTDPPSKSQHPTARPSTPLPTDPHGRVFIPEQGSRCKIDNREDRFELFNDTTLDNCDNKCGFNQDCKSYNYNTETLECTTYRFRVKRLTPKKPNNVCVRIPKATPAPISSPSAAPTTAPVTAAPVPAESHGKVFERNVGFRCKIKDETAYELFESFTFYDCDNKCGFSKSCMSYNYNDETQECTTYDFRVKRLTPKKPQNLCARVGSTAPTLAPVKPTKKPAKPTKRPVKPTNRPVKPTKRPVVKPTKKPVAAPVCTLEVTLGFGFKDPDDAPYYGYHADWIEVFKKDSPDEHVCSSYYNAKNDLPTWCSYRNSDENGDSAFVSNLEDEYYTLEYLKENEHATQEKLRIKTASEYPTKINVYHYLFENDYYTSLKTWNDYMMAASLSIYNVSNEKQDQIGRDLKHPTSKDVPTHIKKNGKWVGNPDYKGNFGLTVTCTKNCFCEVSNLKVFGGFVEYRLPSKADGNGNKKPRNERLENGE